MWETTRDGEGLRAAIVELLEESFAFSRMPKPGEGGAAAAALLPQRKLSPGYHRMGDYLMWLEQRVEARIPMMALASFEADGLCAVAAARNEFKQHHPPCGACGALQDGPFMLKCHACGAEFKR